MCLYGKKCVYIHGQTERYVLCCPWPSNVYTYRERGGGGGREREREIAGFVAELAVQSLARIDIYILCVCVCVCVCGHTTYTHTHTHTHIAGFVAGRAVQSLALNIFKVCYISCVLLVVCC